MAFKRKFDMGFFRQTNIIQPHTPISTVITMTALRLTFLLIVFFIQNAIADTLILTDGTKLRGTYAGGSRTRIRFELKDRIRSIPVEDIESLTFNRPKTIDISTRFPIILTRKIKKPGVCPVFA